MPPLESIEPPLFEDKGDRTVSRDAFDLPPSNNPIHESPTVARSEPRTTIGSLSLATTSASTSASLRRAGGARGLGREPQTTDIFLERIEMQTREFP